MQGQFKHRFQADYPTLEVVEAALLLLHQPRHIFHLFVHADHGGEGLENPINDAHS